MGKSCPRRLFGTIQTLIINLVRWGKLKIKAWLQSQGIKHKLRLMHTSRSANFTPPILGSVFIYLVVHWSTGSPSSLYESHKEHNMASNYKGLHGIFYKISMKVVNNTRMEYGKPFLLNIFTFNGLHGYLIENPIQTLIIRHHIVFLVWFIKRTWAACGHAWRMRNLFKSGK